jgi:CRP-like cAMP-binding protein
LHDEEPPAQPAFACGSQALAPHLKLAHFDQHHVLFEADEEIHHVHFPSGAVVSLVITLSTGEMIEAAMVGTDGVVGAAAALDGKVALSRGIVQLGGDIVVCDIDALKSTALQSPKLLSLLIRHEQTVYAQAQQSAACFATHLVEARLCRWLLRARDLSASDNLPFTQEYLGEMLGVRRTSVTAVRPHAAGSRPDQICPRQDPDHRRCGAAAKRL